MRGRVGDRLLCMLKNSTDRTSLHLVRLLFTPPCIQRVQAVLRYRYCPSPGSLHVHLYEIRTHTAQCVQTVKRVLYCLCRPQVIKYRFTESTIIFRSSILQGFLDPNRGTRTNLIKKVPPHFSSRQMHVCEGTSCTV